MTPSATDGIGRPAGIAGSLLPRAALAHSPAPALVLRFQVAGEIRRTWGTRYVNFVAYAQTDKLDCRKGNGLTVEKGAGHLSVIHYSAQ